MDETTALEAARRRLAELRREARHGFAVFEQLMRDGEPLPDNADKRASNWIRHYQGGRVPSAVQALLVYELVRAGCGKGKAYEAVAKAVGMVTASAVSESYRSHMTPAVIEKLTAAAHTYERK